MSITTSAPRFFFRFVHPDSYCGTTVAIERPVWLLDEELEREELIEFELAAESFPEDGEQAEDWLYDTTFVRWRGRSIELSEDECWFVQHRPYQSRSLLEYIFATENGENEVSEADMEVYLFEQSKFASRVYRRDSEGTYFIFCEVGNAPASRELAHLPYQGPWEISCGGATFRTTEVEDVRRVTKCWRDMGLRVYGNV